MSSLFVCVFHTRCSLLNQRGFYPFPVTSLATLELQHPKEKVNIFEKKVDPLSLDISVFIKGSISDVSQGCFTYFLYFFSTNHTNPYLCFILSILRSKGMRLGNNLIELTSIQFIIK